MKQTENDELEDAFAGFSIIKEYEDKGYIKSNEPVVWYISREKRFNVDHARSTNRDLTLFREKGITKEWWSDFSIEVLDYMKDNEAQNRVSAKQFYSEVIDLLENKLNAKIELQKKIIDFINTVKNDDFLEIDQFVNGYRRVYKLIFKKLLEKYPPFDKHYDFKRRLVRFGYLKDLLKSSLASLYASLIQATNGAEHRVSEQESQDEFGFIFDDEYVGQIDDDKFLDYYNKDMFKTLCLGLFAFIESAGKLLDDKSKINEWDEITLLDNYDSDDIITVRVYRILLQKVLVKTKTRETGYIHISQISNERVKDINDHLSVGDIIKVKFMRKEQEFSLKRVNITEVKDEAVATEEVTEETISEEEPSSEDEAVAEIVEESGDVEETEAIEEVSEETISEEEPDSKNVAEKEPVTDDKGPVKKDEITDSVEETTNSEESDGNVDDIA